jgi:hypothetical protein
VIFAVKSLLPRRSQRKTSLKHAKITLVQTQI